MISIDCPSCRKPMGIDENELNTEWECPECATAFLVHQTSDGSLRFQITSQAGHAIQEESGRNNRRRRLNRANTEAPAAQAPMEARFPDLQPAPAPALVTVSGFGVSFLGSRDPDEATGSYVTSHCLVLCFVVPIFFMSAYRVIDAPPDGSPLNRRWVVLGKVPLSPQAKFWNWAMLGVILLGLMMCLFSIR